MSCGGNTFRCGIGRFNKFTTADKPSNQQLHNENESNLSALLRLREQQDKGIFNIPNQNNLIDTTINNTNVFSTTNNITNNAENIYTPFKYKY